MNEKPEITRNDITAIAYLKKIVDRLSKAEAEYEVRTLHNQAMAMQISSMVNVVQQVHSSGAHNHGLNAIQHAQAQYAQAQYAQALNQTQHIHSIPFTIPPFTPYLTEAEYNVLKAWADGDDILVHLLSADR